MSLLSWSRLLLLSTGSIWTSFIKRPDITWTRRAMISRRRPPRVFTYEIWGNLVEAPRCTVDDLLRQAHTVTRVLKPGGVLACYSYLGCTPIYAGKSYASTILEIGGMLNNYFPEEHKHLWTEYGTLPAFSPEEQMFRLTDVMGIPDERVVLRRRYKYFLRMWRNPAA
nr:uncharacterized protein LOC128699006 [Cherax quadricarinatus]